MRKELRQLNKRAITKSEAREKYQKKIDKYTKRVQINKNFHFK